MFEKFFNSPFYVNFRHNFVITFENRRKKEFFPFSDKNFSCFRPVFFPFSGRFFRSGRSRDLPRSTEELVKFRKGLRLCTAASASTDAPGNHQDSWPPPRPQPECCTLTMPCRSVFAGRRPPKERDGTSADEKSFGFFLVLS